MKIISFVPNYVPNFGGNKLGRIRKGMSGVRKIDAFLQPCKKCAKQFSLNEKYELTLTALMW